MWAPQNNYGIPEQIDDGDEGILIKPGDSELLFKKLQLLLDKPSLAKKLALNGNKKLRQEFTIEKMLDQYESLIQNISDAPEILTH